MKQIADLHIHSHYSRATSKDLNFEQLTRWAQLKGVHLLGTGDIAHPGWLQEMRDKLVPAEEGLFRLKDDLARDIQLQVFPSCHNTVRFMLAGEISNIYKRHDATRKVHNVIFAPSLRAVEQIQIELEKIGNIRSDGRPILGLDSRDLLEIVLSVDERCHLIPAHIWTPWFSMLGSKSGFDSVEECFGDLTSHIFALETGLSSDPPMNWRVSNLDRYTLVSNSDAHSPPKLAREATVFDTEWSYDAFFAALKSGDPATFGGTIEFFPEEGKYHLDGHRKCGVCWEPPETLAHDYRCPVCGKPVTVGVMHRVETLADRPSGAKPPRTHPFTSLIPLPELLSELLEVGPNTKTVRQQYDKLLSRLGPELNILQDIPLADIETAGDPRLAEAIRRMRSGQIVAQGGYDGEYGVVKVFAPGAESAPGTAASPQLDLFGNGEAISTSKTQAAESPVEYVADLQSNAKQQANHTLQENPESDVGADGEPLLTDSAPSVQEWEPLALFDNEPQPFDEIARPKFMPTGNSEPTLEQTPIEAIPPEAGSRQASPIPDWLERLNDEQRAAVACTDTPLVIVAGPGTGKTRTLTVRIASLMHHHGVSPSSILAITFTNKAAGEMLERLIGLLGDEIAGQLTIKTFHAFAVQLLRDFGEHLGIPANFAIATEVERHTILQRTCPDLTARELSQLLDQISHAKNQLLVLEPDFGVQKPASNGSDFHAEMLPTDDAPGRAQFLSLYQRYTDALAAAHMLDFDDLILFAVRLLAEHNDVRRTVQARYRWISVDEYQDINVAQYRLLRLLTDDSGGNSVNLCVIGDPDQAIYGFRGADRQYFLRFQEDYPAAKLMHLRQSYRSPQTLLDAAMQVIAKDPDHRASQLFSEFVDEVKLELFTAPTDKAEAEYVVHQIEQMVGGTSYFSLDSGRVDDDNAASRTFGDFAILYRLSAQSRLLIEAFERSGMPYQIVGRQTLYSHKDIQTILSGLWVLYAPNARPHLERVVAALGIDTTQPEVAALFDSAPDSTSTDAPQNGRTQSPWRKLVEVPPLAARDRPRLHALAEFWRKFVSGSSDSGEKDLTSTSVRNRIQLIAGFLARHAPDLLNAGHEERLAQLLRLAAPHDDHLGRFLESVALHSETDTYDPRADRITLMTLHAAKGLEFPVVFMVGCEAGLLPYRPQHADRSVDVDEERRLFYVGLTRAQDKLLLLRAKRRFLFGQQNENAPSPFVDDIAAALKAIRQSTPRPAKKERPEDLQMSLF